MTPDGRPTAAEVVPGKRLCWWITYQEEGHWEVEAPTDADFVAALMAVGGIDWGDCGARWVE